MSDLTPPGTMVFTCLSADIIAHETTHALLDGQARTMREPSNPDVRAFHEGFADIVALFQQFTYRDLVRREIARARTDLSASTMLGKLAPQFGEGTGLGGALRRYPDLPSQINYATTFATHARGSLLVAAVYQAFLAIVERRTGDLIRLATGGSGVLPEGAIHPDLVNRLTDETCKAAAHVLKMCIRAIDYCPLSTSRSGNICGQSLQPTWKRCLTTGTTIGSPFSKPSGGASSCPEVCERCRSRHCAGASGRVPSRRGLPQPLPS
ncbi:hypothetical protein [Rhizobium sp. RCAM05973]|uniref:hypothetical protein n=1 Tax=Rhizobium sp. RCAM05973 TaxID=2994066 RepID=UPI0022EC100A|nr:hypothetical protein [Rhizobium sp. RCAM05973]